MPDAVPCVGLDRAMWLLGSAAVALLISSFTPIRKNREEGRPGCLGAPGLCCGTANAGWVMRSVYVSRPDILLCGGDGGR